MKDENDGSFRCVACASKHCKGSDLLKVSAILNNENLEGRRDLPGFTFALFRVPSRFFALYRRINGRYNVEILNTYTAP